jgi:hypothetical protein
MTYSGVAEGAWAGAAPAALSEAELFAAAALWAHVMLLTMSSATTAAFADVELIRIRLQVAMLAFLISSPLNHFPHQAPYS